MDGALARVIVGPTPGGLEQPVAQPRAERFLSVVTQPRETTETAEGVTETATPDDAAMADTQELPLALVMPLPLNRDTAPDAADPPVEGDPAATLDPDLASPATPRPRETREP